MNAIPQFSYNLPAAIKLPAVAKKRRFSVNEVQDAAWGRWKEIFVGLGLSAATLRKRGGPCPQCKGDSWFRISDLDGTIVFTCKAPGRDPLHGDGFEALQHIQVADSYRKAEKAVVSWLNRNLDASGTLIKGVRRQARPNARLLTTFMSGSEPFNGTGIAGRYFAHSGLAGIMRDLRDLPRLHFQPALPSFSFRRRTPPSPALIAQLVDASGIVRGVHVTRLAENRGGAPVAKRRQLRKFGKDGSLAGTAVRLYEASDRLALVQGIESALDVRIKTGWPVWAAISPDLMAAVELPEEIREVRVYVDGKAGGVGAAEKLTSRLRVEGRTVEIESLDSAPANAGAA